MLCSVVIEVRQHLCCANVFLNFSQSVSDVDSLKINVEERVIRLKDATEVTVAELNVDKYFRILTETFSNLVVDGENISFRVSVRDIEDLEQYDAKCQDALSFDLEENKEASLHCRQCESTLCAPTVYEKIREYPSGAIDVSEFFCHHGPSFSDILLPRIQDLFYGFQFIILNRENVEHYTKERDGHVYCLRCKRYLGEHMLDGKAVKLWSESVTWKRHNGSVPVDLFHGEHKYMPEMLILKVIKETSLPSPEPLLRNMHFTKVLLECSLPSRNQQYLLIHIMEKYLPVLRNAQQQNRTFNTEPQQRLCQLEMQFAFKILYRLIDPVKTSDTDEPGSESPMLTYWQQDINIIKMKISPFLFLQLLDDLECNSLMLPKMFRNNKDQFNLSYIFH